MDADAARAAGLDPLTLRAIALDTGAGANLLEVVPLPAGFSYSSFEPTRLPAAVRVPLRLPDPAAGRAGRRADVRDAPPTRRSRHSPRSAASGSPAARRRRPARTSSALFRDALGAARPSATGRPRRPTSAAVTTLLDNFWDGEVSSSARRISEELEFELVIEPDDGAPPVVISGSIDRIDRLPSGGIEVIDYKTGRIELPEGASTRASSCRSTRWPAATPWASARRSG